MLDAEVVVIVDIVTNVDVRGGFRNKRRLYNFMSSYVRRGRLLT